MPTSEELMTNRTDIMYEICALSSCRQYPAAQWVCDDGGGAAQPTHNSEEECMRGLGVPPRLRAVLQPDSHVPWTEVDPDSGMSSMFIHTCPHTHSYALEAWTRTHVACMPKSTHAHANTVHVHNGMQVTLLKPSSTIPSFSARNCQHHSLQRCERAPSSSLDSQK